MTLWLLLGGAWGLAVGAALGLSLRQRGAFLRVLGPAPAPPFEVDALAARALAACTGGLDKGRRAAALAAARRAPVRFLGPGDPRLGAFPFALRGGAVFVAEGAGWERRLALALAHAARHAALGDADTAGKDRVWFAAAARAADVFSGAVAPKEES